MDSLTLANLAAYVGQTVIVAAVATLLAWALRIETPGVRYGFWRMVLALCLVLPIVQGRQAGSVEISTRVVEVRGVSQWGAATAALAEPPIDWPFALSAFLAVGGLLRLLWLGASLSRLARLRRTGAPVTGSELHAELQHAIGTTAEIRYVPFLRQPVTFGLLRPVVLLPGDLAARGADVERAVLSHELLHVKRRDWGWLLAEELTCALLWFNPAIWWLISRVQLAREVVVDELAVLATGRRRAYIEALVAFADSYSRPPAMAFGGRRKLFHRIVLLSKEAGMSSKRLVFTCTVAAVALAGGSTAAIRALPLLEQSGTIRQTTPGPLEQRAKPITPENPVPRRVNYEAPVTPAEARAAGAVASVSVMITLDELGRVAEARGLQIAMTSRNPPVNFNLTNASAIRDLTSRVGLTGDQADTVVALVAAYEQAVIQAVQQWRYEPPAAGPISFPITVGFSDTQESTDMQGVPTRGFTVRSSSIATEGAVRVGGNIRSPAKIVDVKPVYPAIAQANKISGLVILEIRVGRDGAVEDAQVLRSIPLLDAAALEAVKGWRFTPTLLNGAPVPVVMTVTVNFNLQGGGVSGGIPGGFAASAAGGVPNGVSGGVVTGAGGAQSTGARKLSPQVLKEVKPKYTKEAMDAGVQGAVQMEIQIGPDGSVTDARVVRSLPMLDDAALEAVRQWKFAPIPEPATVTIEMTFNMRPKR